MKLQLGEPVLFLDDTMIAVKSGVKRHFHQAVKKQSNPLLTPDRDWEMECAIYGTVIYDREARLFKMWYSSLIVGAVAPFTMYATSKDGLHWKKPVLNLFKVPNRKVDNNIVLASLPSFRHEMQTVLFEPDDKPARRYKMLVSAGRYRPTGRHKIFIKEGAYFIRYSTDGIRFRDGMHFNKGEKFVVEKPGYVDTAVLVRDPVTRIYRLYHRASYPPGRDKLQARSVAYKESADLKHWTPSRLILHTDEQDPKNTQIYKFSPFPYGNYWVGLVNFYHSSARQFTLLPQLALSLDSIRWKRNREPFIPLGRPGEWDRFYNSDSTQPLVVGNELWFYYSGRTYRHPPYSGKDNGPEWGAIGLARLRLDGFASLDASFDSSGIELPPGTMMPYRRVRSCNMGGTVKTKPFVLPAGELFVNARADYGEVVVEVLSENGLPLVGYKSIPLKEDGIFLPVTWQNGRKLYSLQGKTVSLRFTMTNARLYAFRVGKGTGLAYLSSVPSRIII